MLYFSILTAVLLLDQVTKILIIHFFTLYEMKEVIPGFFNLVYVTNTGAAFSMFADVDSPFRHYFFVAISCAALLGITLACTKYKKVNRLYTPALALIAGGAAGNLVDRIRFGAVVDFLDFYLGTYHWPAFNVADSAICVGAGLFLFINLRENKN